MTSFGAGRLQPPAYILPREVPLHYLSGIRMSYVPVMHDVGLSAPNKRFVSPSQD
jgi:hypothetical protein